MMQRLRVMIEKKAPYYMKVGGWSGGCATSYKVGRKRYSPAQVAEIVRLAKEGLTFEAIAKQTGCDSSNVGKVARQHGIKRGCKGNGGANNIYVKSYKA